MNRYLYHGSKFDNKGAPLVPGIVHTKKETFWDGRFESNRFLYACDSETCAILLGFGSMAEKELGTNGFKYNLDDKAAHFMFSKENLLTEKEVKEKLKDVTTYMYAIKVSPAHGWVENHNAINGIDGEYKTNGAIPVSDYAMTDIKVLEWLTRNNWTIISRLRTE